MNTLSPSDRRVDLESLFASLTASGLARRLIQLAREEDLGSEDGLGDITSRVCIEASTEGQATIVARQAGVIAGMRVVPMVLQAFAPTTAFQGRAADGHRADKGQILGILQGPVRELLAAERTLLNFVGRLSGIATLTSKFVETVADASKVAGLKQVPKVLDTRKTTPGMRILEKYAVACGGGTCHRVGLFDAVLIKDNHLAGVSVEELAAFVTAAATRARALAAESRLNSGNALVFVEAEVDSLDQLTAILNAGGCNLDVVLLDNMTLDELREAVRLRDASKMNVELEASGGVSLATVGSIASTGVDRISVGQLTHSAVCLDVALDM
ncbi:MAG: carboxylating nicotinate-nucleotide diphosphorylase [Pyrinomonadaceae bacterium]|nr:carboxylating nicotinate-nucleotide diphosphorylase [Phycisphaerales bacterium]